MGMSLGRKTGSQRNSYSAYTQSPVWRARRRRWFQDCRKRGFEPACQVCGQTLTELGTLDLHHLSYQGVEQNSKTAMWISKETDEELLPLCRDDHESLHRILDENRRDYWGWDRRRATVVVLSHLRRKHQHLKLSSKQISSAGSPARKGKP